MTFENVFVWEKWSFSELKISVTSQNDCLFSNFFSFVCLNKEKTNKQKIIIIYLTSQNDCLFSIFFSFVCLKQRKDKQTNKQTNKKLL